MRYQKKVFRDWAEDISGKTKYTPNIELSTALLIVTRAYRKMTQLEGRAWPKG